MDSTYFHIINCFSMFSHTNAPNCCLSNLKLTRTCDFPYSKISHNHPINKINRHRFSSSFNCNFIWILTLNFKHLSLLSLSPNYFNVYSIFHLDQFFPISTSPRLPKRTYPLHLNDTENHHET